MMSAPDAWKVLGFDPASIFVRLSKLPRKDRILAAEEDLEMARKSAKNLMAKHHPDRGGDSNRFKMVNESIQALEVHTQEFIKKMNEAIKLAEEKLEKRPVFIKIGS